MMNAFFTATRRHVLAASAGTLAWGALPAAARTATKSAVPTPTRVTLDAMADEILRLTPEQATSLGVDTGARAALRGKVSDGSAAGDARFAAEVASIDRRLKRLPRAGMAADDRLRVDTVAYAAERGLEAKQWFYASAAEGFFGGASPYAINQQSSAVSNLPEFLDSQQPVKSRADAEAYLARTAGMARALDNERRRIAEDAARGVVPPDFIAATTLGQLKGYRATPAAEQKIVTSLATRTAAQGIAGEWAGRAQQMVERLIYPALDRQIAAFSAATANAPHDAGVQRLPDGDAYYRWALRLGTTTTTPPDEIHRIGLAQNEELKAKMDGLLRQQGMTRGSVGARLQALTNDPKQVFSDDDAGREQLIAYLNGKIAAIRPLMPKLSHLALNADVTVKRVPADIQDGAALGYMNFASLDGSRPAIYYVNLKSTSLWPKYQLATLTAHEALPGHAWQGAYLAENSADIPLIASLLGFNAFVEGWALYSEQLVDEAGLYDDDPLSRLGYLQAQQFRACRLVADTGLHSMRWSREKTVKFLMDETGRGEGAMTSETDRYCVAPGQACGYKTGHNEILRLRAAAQARLGDRFDLAGFDDALVRTGGVPLSLLEGVIQDWTDSRAA